MNRPMPTYISIPLNQPESYELFFLCMDSSSADRVKEESLCDSNSKEQNNKADLPHMVVDSIYRNERDAEPIAEYMDGYLNWAQTSTKPLNSEERDFFFELLESCNLSEIERMVAMASKAVLRINAKRTSQSYFSSFWACHIAAQELSQWVDSMTVDLHEGTAVTSQAPVWHRHAKGIPLTGSFLTVVASPSETPHCYDLRTDGMSRFGLPELSLRMVPSNLGSDGAYLLRTVAQYLWSQLDNLHPEQDCLHVRDSLKISSKFCEYDNPKFQEDDEFLIPCRFEVEKENGDCVIELSQTDEFEDHLDWMIYLIQSIRDLRLRLAQVETMDSIAEAIEASHNTSVA